MIRKLSANSRLVNELFANYISTFIAFCELINNSIQAKSENIRISLDYTPDNELHPNLIKSITILDDGKGVHADEIEKKLLNIGTDSKEGGKGIGRFAAFQIGEEFTVETVGYNPETKTYSKTIVPLHTSTFTRSKSVADIEIETKEEFLEGLDLKTYYKVTINKLYDSVITEKEPKKKLIDKFLQSEIRNSIFERYPIKIFNRGIKFYINDSYLDPNEFIIGQPGKRRLTFIDKKGNSHKVHFDLFNIKSGLEKIKIFLTITNAGIQTIASSFEYDAPWLSPKIGSWFIYIWSETLPTDMYRNFDLDGLDEDVRHYKQFLKSQLNDFFREKNKEFDNFTTKLKNDEYYPYREKEASSKSKEFLFDKFAYLVEDKYQLLMESNKLREIIYPLIDRTISNGHLSSILSNILKLNNKLVDKFSALLEKSELESIIEFSDKVATKCEELEFLEKIVYSDISANVKERKELHKFLEHMLWVFGEEYQDSTKLLSDKSLVNNLQELRNKFLKYKPSKKDDNISELKDRKIKSITDLFLYSERILDAQKKEVLIVELKAPKVKISPKELDQVMRYASEIEEMGVFPDRVNYKILLVSSDINRRATFDINGRQTNTDNPYFYFQNENKNIEVWVMKWSDIFENIKRKLSYLTEALKTKDVDIEKKISKDFEEIDFGKIRSSLKKVANA